MEELDLMLKKMITASLVLAYSLISPAVAEQPTVHSKTALDPNYQRHYPPEFDEAIELTPNLENGKKLYRNCVSCHGPEGWGNRSGSYPQIAGQLRGVVIKQLADFRAGNRDNPIMRAFTSAKALGGAQEIADVAGYIANMPMTTEVDHGPRTVYADGEAIYKDMCAKCHGDGAEGDLQDHGPSLYSQHYSYLKRQFDWIRDGRRRNADSKMTKQIMDFKLRDEIAVLHYVAKIKPPEEKVAEPGWLNPDFPNFVRSGQFDRLNR